MFDHEFKRGGQVPRKEINEKRRRRKQKDFFGKTGHPVKITANQEGRGRPKKNGGRDM